MSLFGRRSKTSQASYEDRLNEILYKVPGTDEFITWRDAVEGTLIAGATGSGKSSGPGRHIAHAMIKSGFGMCILCAKKEEKRRWLKYIEEAAPKRMDDVVVFDQESGLQFNFIQYEMERSANGSGDPLNAIEALMNLHEINQIYLSGGGGKGDERFWDNGLRRIMARAIETLRLAGEPISISNMIKLISDCLNMEEVRLYEHLKSLATTNENIDLGKRRQANEDLKSWIENNYFLQVINRVEDSLLSEGEQESRALILKYWLHQFPGMGERTSNIILESFLGMAEPFIGRGILKNHFSSDLSPELLPEEIYQENKIVIIDFSVKEYGIAGIYASVIYKTIFQKAMERRDIENEDNPKLVGLFIDEWQNFCNPKTDSQFQVTARSSWIASVYITQNINNIYFVMGNSQAVPRAKSLLGNLNLKYFASNADFETNQWASEQIGKHLVDFENVSISKDIEISKTKNQQLHYRVPPDHFTVLKTGGKANKYTVEAVLFKPGKTWGKEKQNYALVSFNQR